MIRNRFSGDASGDGGNTISKNTTKGIRLFYADGNRVEANNVWGTTGDGWGIQTRGIQTTTGASNFILKNTCVGNGTNYELDSGDTAGPIVSASDFLSGTDPWANFSRSPQPSFRGLHPLPAYFGNRRAEPDDPYGPRPRSEAEKFRGHM